MARLLLESGGATTCVDLGERNLLGSASSCTIVVEDPSIAPEQVEIQRLSDGSYRLFDTGPAEATSINQRPVIEALLVDGDVIRLGEITATYQEGGTSDEVEESVEHNDISVLVSVQQEGVPQASGAEDDDQDLESTITDLQRLQAAYELTRSIGIERDVEAVFERVLDTAFALFHADRGGIFLVDPDRGSLTAPRARTRHRGPTKLSFSRSVVRRALDGQEVLISSSRPLEWSEHGAGESRTPDVESLMSVPMVWAEEVVGVIYLDTLPGSGNFSRKDLSLLTTFARQAAGAVKNAHLLTALRAANRELRQKNDELQKLVVRDPLTRLYNHAYLQELVEQEIRRCDRYGLGFGFLLVDIDGFRGVNNQHGHAAGDRILCAIAETFQRGRRRVDIGARLVDQPIATRYGKDTFAILLPGTTKRGAAVTAERLRDGVCDLDLTASGLPAVTVSVGVVSYPADARERAGLITAAEVSLNAAKRAGGNQTVAFSQALAPPSDGEIDDEIARIVALERVITGEALTYVYQPIVRAGDGEILGYEALCRPRDDAFATPLELLSTAERAGRIGELGHIMRRIATVPLSRLSEPLLLFINLHPLELTDALLRWGEGFPLAARLVLEVTESADITRQPRTRELLRQLKSMGFRIALDDLGAGYAGLHALALLEPDFVKLDMRMVQNIHTDSRTARLVKYILDFAHDEGMQVIAEGIETAIERRVVTQLGCGYLQGYYFARPQPPFCAVQVPA